jgi:tRNA pseudouridine38-40 synthase
MTICAESFIHNMVRIIAGTIFEILRDNKPPESILDVLHSKNREVSGLTAPAYALYLNTVTYDPSLSTYPDAYSQHFR